MVKIALYSLENEIKSLGLCKFFDITKYVLKKTS